MLHVQWLVCCFWGREGWMDGWVVSPSSVCPRSLARSLCTMVKSCLEGMCVSAACRRERCRKVWGFWTAGICCYVLYSILGVSPVDRPVLRSSWPALAVLTSLCLVVFRLSRVVEVVIVVGRCWFVGACTCHQFWFRKELILDALQHPMLHSSGFICSFVDCRLPGWSCQ